MAAHRSKAELRAAALAAREALSGKARAAAAKALARRGLPVDVTVKLPALPAVNVALLPLVIAPR